MQHASMDAYFSATSGKFHLVLVDGEFALTYVWLPCFRDIMPIHTQSEVGCVKKLSAQFLSSGLGSPGPLTPR